MTISWKLILIGIFILVIFILYGYMQNLRLSKKIEILKTDEGQTVKQNEDWIKTCEDEISKISQERDQIRKEKEVTSQQKLQAIAEAQRQKEINNDLQAQLDRVNVSSDPVLLLRDLQGRGIHIRSLGPK